MILVWSKLSCINVHESCEFISVSCINFAEEKRCEFARNLLQTELVKEDCEEEKEGETLMEGELSPGNRTASFDLCWPLVNVIVPIMTMHFVTQTIIDGLESWWRDEAALSIYSWPFSLMLMLRWASLPLCLSVPGGCSPLTENPTRFQEPTPQTIGDPRPIALSHPRPH